MNILIVSATKKEIEQILCHVQSKSSDYERVIKTDFFDNTITFLITGIGVYATMYHLIKILANNKFDIVINVGIAGSYSRNIKVGDVVNVVSEQIGDLGINDNGVFKTLFEMNYVSKNNFPFQEGVLMNTNEDFFKFIPKIRQVSGLTLNTCSGDLKAIQLLHQKFDVKIESMEGAAVFYVCISENKPFLELRSISNLVTFRNKENWEIMTAINNLNQTLKMLLFEICSKS